MVDRARRTAIDHLYTSRKKFGLTKAEYLDLYRDARCAICGTEVSWVSGKEARLVIDHDHSMEGKFSIRGILCHACNAALGWAEDNPDLLRAMATYLDLFKVQGGPFGREK